ncbi:MAG TPA: peptide chain release factor 3 [Candidatus Marinimicrobia bacterium]|nr:peptide chain release factor 3 [Candidatus Neomarinimicrobiota bacterium]
MTEKQRLKEIRRRRTFAIISHPDAGKTTLTEKLLLFGGAIREAGAVKSNKINRNTMSDFMEIERQRGISVATSVMGFEYNGIKINILDTPGHKDFAEDTYRTLSAVDSAIIVIDVAKGVEEQTEKLVSVCRMRKIPVIVFINKLDRMGLDAVELLDEIEAKLDLKVTPLSWPVGMGPSFKGVFNIFEQKLALFKPHGQQSDDETIVIRDLDDPLLNRHLDSSAETLREELALVRGVYPDFNVEDYRKGELAPVFYGSAINNFGVKELLDCFIHIAPSPIARETDIRVVEPGEEAFTGFIFKIHANIDPNHRTRIAFIRICSGKFERGKPYYHTRLNREFRFSGPTSFMANKKEVIDVAFPGDVVGVNDNGNFKIGDTLTEGESMRFKGIPNFSPEQFRYIENTDSMKHKQLAKGLEQLMDEGVAQLFVSQQSNRRIIGTVGALQFDVIQYRLEHEYGASCRYEPLNLYKACWMTCPDDKILKEFRLRKARYMALDKYKRDVFMAESPWALNRAMEEFPDIKFHFSSEF